MNLSLCLVTKNTGGKLVETCGKQKDASLGIFFGDKFMVGSRGLEPLTSSTSRKRSSQLS